MILLQFESDEFYFWLSSPVKPSFFLTSKGKQSLDPELKRISQVSKKPISSHGFTIERCMAISKVVYKLVVRCACKLDFFFLSRMAVQFH